MDDSDWLSDEEDSVLTSLCKRLNRNKTISSWVYYDYQSREDICLICNTLISDFDLSIKKSLSAQKQHGLIHLREHNLLCVI